MNTPTLKTERLTLRKFTEQDMEETHDLGDGLCKEFWNRGIATEAAKKVIEQVKKDGLPYITATHDKNNP